MRGVRVGDDAIRSPVHDQGRLVDTTRTQSCLQERRTRIELRTPGGGWCRRLEPEGEQLLELLPVLLRPSWSEGQGHRCPLETLGTQPCSLGPGLQCRVRYTLRSSPARC